MTLDNFTTDPNLVNAEWAGAAADQVEQTIEEADRIEAQAAADAQQKQAEEDELPLMVGKWMSETLGQTELIGGIPLM